MKQIKTLGLVITASFILASCGGSKKDGEAAINDIKAKLEKAKKDHAESETNIKALETELLKLDSNAANAAKVKLVGVLPVTVQKFEHYIDLQGKVDAEDISYISPRMGPAQVKAIFVKQGQFVKKGQLLLKLDDAIMRQSVTAAKQQLEGIKTQLTYAKNIYGRQKNLWDQGIGTEVQLIAAKTNVTGLENQLSAAGEQVKTMEAQLNTSNVYSDVTGIADIVAIRVGETFSGMAATGPQIKIVNTSALKVVVSVPENYSTRMHNGSPVLINVPDANKVNLSSTISLISQSVDPTMRGFTAEAKIPTSADLKPNQTAVMRIRDYSADKAIVIPVNMVQTDEKGKYVFIMIKGSNGKAIAKKVVVLLGEIYGESVEIKSGLTGGEQLITEGYQGLYEGQSVSTGTK